jgi:tetratricopeptide (TPR) repeat protein
VRARLVVALLAAAAAASASSSSGAAAADVADDAQREARRLKELGADAYRRHEFARALELFRQAHDAYASPNLLYDVALALDGLGRATEALSHYEQFVALAPNAPPRARAHAQERIAALKSAAANQPKPAAVAEAPPAAAARVPPVVAPARTAPAHVEPARRPLRKRWWFWFSLGAAAATVAGAVVLGVELARPAGSSLGPWRPMPALVLRW